MVAPIAAVAFTLLACAGLVVWAGAPVGKAYLLLFDGAFGSRFAHHRDAHARHTADAHRPGCSGRVPRALLQHRRRGPALPRRARCGRGRRRRHRRAPRLAVTAHDRRRHGCRRVCCWSFPRWPRPGSGVDEVVTTLLLNFVALLFVSMMLDGPMKDPMAMGWPQSVAIPRRARVQQAAGALARALRLDLRTGARARAVGGQHTHDLRLRDARGRCERAGRALRRHLGQHGGGQDRAAVGGAGGAGGRGRSGRAAPAI